MIANKIQDGDAYGRRTADNSVETRRSEQHEWSERHSSHLKRQTHRNPLDKIKMCSSEMLVLTRREVLLHVYAFSPDIDAFSHVKK